MSTMKRVAVTLVLALGAAANVLAQTRPADLARVTLEDLMKVEITSASRKGQLVEVVPAAVFVITQEDIRRSGIRSLPELFRLVPGMQVAQVNANKGAVSVRGFNDVFSDKLLVLIDGRSIYKRTFSGVFWHAEDLMLEDIERIEVIRGAGGAIWGANAVNGVINIITKPAAETQGALVRVGTGTQDRSEGTARYGGTLGAVSYRVFGLWSEHGDGLIGRDGTPAGDDWSTFKTGMRLDWVKQGHTVMAQGSFLDGRQLGLWVVHSPIPGFPAVVSPDESTARTGDVLTSRSSPNGRWTPCRDRLRSCCALSGTRRSRSHSSRPPRGRASPDTGWWSRR